MTEDPKPHAHDDAADAPIQGVSAEEPAEGAEDAPAGDTDSPDAA